MATTTNVDGTLMRLYKGTVAIADLLSNDMDITIDKLTTSSKSGSGWGTHLRGEKNGSFSFDGNFRETGGITEITFDELMTDAIAGTVLTVVMSTMVTGDTKWSASCTIGNLKLTSAYNDLVKFSGQLDLTGAPTISIVS